MKIRVCYECGRGNPVKVIRQLDACEANLLTRYRKNGKAFMEIRDKTDQRDPSHKWKYVREQVITRPDPDAPATDEDIICYIVEDLENEETSTDNRTFDDVPSGNMSAHYESPEYGGVRK